jgi:cytochrome c oxidase cbb3-type subunit III
MALLTGEERPFSVTIESRAMNQNLGIVLLAAALAQAAVAQSPTPAAPSPEQLNAGKALFLEKCAFCHGPDTAGGESGPDLTRSTVVANDINGNRIAPVVHDGRPQAGMPAFTVSEQEMSALVAFIHHQKTVLEKNGGRRGVDEADLRTGNAEAGKKYFNGAGKCASCHSPTGDLAGIASRLKGLKLEQRMLNPGNASAKVTVTLPSGETVTGHLAYHDEFTVGLKDANGWYRSWPTDSVRFTIDAPAEAHVDLLGKYTDDDIHNLMAYLQTLR